MPHIVVPIGVTCLGVVVGWLVRYFIRRFKKFAPGVLSSLLSIILGGAVLKFLAVDNVTIWYYPIGLLAGFVAYQVIVMYLLRDTGSSGGAKGSLADRFRPDEPRYIIKPRDDE